MVHEEIKAYGAASISDVKLFANVVLDEYDEERATSIIKKAGSSMARIFKTTIPQEDLGLTESEVSRIESMKEIVRRCASAYSTRILSPSQASRYLLDKCFGWAEEKFGAIALDAKGAVIGFRIISEGTVTATAISPREVFRAALVMGAVSVIAFHNHPSGDPTPSVEDTKLTKRMRMAGESLGIPLADHIIVGSDSCHSFRNAEAWDKSV